MKCIPITNCSSCPHRMHKGAFGKVAYVPRCNLSGKELPYKTEVYMGSERAVATEVIPESCPLEDYPNA